jgi:hypothetical protein
MENFHELIAEKIHGKPTGKHIPGGPVTQINLKVGETKIVALKKYKLGPPPEVVVSTANPQTAFCFQVSKLKDPTKKSYIDKQMSDLNDQLVPVEINGYYYFQICGKTAGTVELTANQRAAGPTFSPYANPVKVLVESNTRGLSLGASFDTLWRNHPLHAANGLISYPCEGNGKNKTQPQLNPPLLNMQCMVRLCWSLSKSGVDLSGMRGFSSCRLAQGKHPQSSHKHHFSNPYEFRQWGPAKGQSYEWSASRYAPEPMPGLAAFWFVMGKTGVILFDHYFDVKGREPMFGGHIDLWNKNTMGNTINSSNVYEGLSAFLRSKRIAYWPID